MGCCWMDAAMADIGERLCQSSGHIGSLLFIEQLKCRSFTKVLRISISTIGVYPSMGLAEVHIPVYNHGDVMRFGHDGANTCTC